MWRQIAAALAVLASALVLTGCGGSTQDAVKAKVQQLAQAVGQRDYSTICQQILASSLVAPWTS